MKIMERISRGKLKEPRILKIIDSKTVVEILMKEFDLSEKEVKVCNDKFGLYLKEDFINFSKQKQVSFLKKKNKYTSTEYIQVFKKKENSWFSGASKNYKSTFGVVTGDIQTSDSHYSFVNFFIDAYQEVWLVEPFTLSIFKLNKKSNITKVEII